MLGIALEVLYTFNLISLKPHCPGKKAASLRSDLDLPAFFLLSALDSLAGL